MKNATPTMFIKMQLIELLNNQVDYISMRQICDELQNSNGNLIRSLCLELQKEIEELYKTEEMALLITKREGVRLQRNGVNMQRLTSAIFSNSSSYNILYTLFLNKSVTTADFCEEYFISRSTLSRKLKRLNQILNTFDLHISLSEHMSLRGEESKIRLFYHFYFHIVHQGIDNLPWHSDIFPSLEVICQLLTYLDLVPQKNTLSDARSFIYISMQRIENHFSISEEDPATEFLSAYEFVEKPAFLTDWNQRDWQLFLLAIYVTDIFSAEKLVKKKTSSIFKKEVALWLTTFEKNVHLLGVSEKENLSSYLDAQLQLQFLFPMTKLLMDLIGVRKYRHFELDFPEYLNHFNQFWEQLSAKSPLFRNSVYMHFSSLMNSIKVLDLTVFNPKIRLFVQSDVTKLHQSFMEKRINYHLAKYTVEFVPSPEKADLVISTLSFRTEQPLPKNVIQICTYLSISDLENITQRVDAFLEN